MLHLIYFLLFAILLQCNPTPSDNGDGIRLFALIRNDNISSSSTDSNSGNNNNSSESVPQPKLSLKSTLKSPAGAAIAGAKLTYNAQGLSSGLNVRQSSDIVVVTTSSLGVYVLTLGKGKTEVAAKSSTGEDLGSLSFDVKSTTEAPVAEVKGDKLGAPVVEVKQSAGFVLPNAEGVTFKDEIVGTGKIGGSINITKASDESKITEYAIYWADELNYKVAEIARFPKNGGNFLYILPETALPTGAKNLLVVTADSSGEMDKGISLLVEDK